MSLAIDVSQVKEVLLESGWHEVLSGSFFLDSYEFVEGQDTVHRGGHSGICATGFYFVDVFSGDKVMGPLSSVLAVKR